MVRKLKNYRRINKRLYHRGSVSYDTKAKILKSQKFRKNNGYTLAIIDKNKDGYFFWIGDKRDKR